MQWYSPQTLTVNIGLLVVCIETLWPTQHVSNLFPSFLWAIFDMTRYGQANIIGPKQKMDENCSSPNWLSSSFGSVFLALLIGFWNLKLYDMSSQSFKFEVAFSSPESESRPIPAAARFENWNHDALIGISYTSPHPKKTPNPRHLWAEDFFKNHLRLNARRNETREPSPTKLTVPNGG